MSVLGRDAHDAKSVLDELANSHGNVISDKALLARLSLALFSPKYLGRGQDLKSSICWRPGGGSVILDDADHKVLWGLMNHSYSSLRDLARQLDVPASTLAWKVKDLKQKGVIVSFIYIINTIPHIYGDV